MIIIFMSKDLTPHQQRIWDMRRPVADGGEGKAYVEIGQELGISPNVVSKTIVAIRRKLGISGQMATAVEYRDPERAAAVMDALTDPRFGNLVAACRAAGLPDRVAEGFIRRLRLKYNGITVEARNLQTRELEDMLGKKIHLAIQYMDDKVMSEASYRDLAMGTAQLIEKRQLLRGEPTAIISDHERKKLHELLPALVAEAQRRQLTIDVTPTKVEIGVEPG